MSFIGTQSRVEKLKKEELIVERVKEPRLQDLVGILETPGKVGMIENVNGAGIDAMIMIAIGAEIIQGITEIEETAEVAEMTWIARVIGKIDAGKDPAMMIETKETGEKRDQIP
jgi:hypothetical protein